MEWLPWLKSCLSMKGKTAIDKYLENEKPVRYFSLQISYLSTSAYLHLSSVFSSATLRTLWNDLAIVSCQPGILVNAIKEVWANIVSGTFGPDCILMFDKMSIRQGFCWNPTTNSYMGYETLADPTVVPDRVATSLIVFLLKGLVNGWESVVAYYFTHALSNDTIRSSLGEVLMSLNENNPSIFSSIGPSFWRSRG